MATSAWRRRLRGIGLAVLAALATVGTTAGQGTPVPDAGPRAVDEGTLLQASLERPGETALQLQLLRITLDPGGRSPWHAHPGIEFGVVEDGTLVVGTRGRAVRRLAGEEATEELPAESEVELAGGDRIAYAPGTEMTFTNPGPGQTTLLAATVLPAGPGAPPGAVFRGGEPTADEVGGVRSRILAEAVVEPDDFMAARGAVVLERLVVAGGESVPAFVGPVLLVVEAGSLAGQIEAEAPATRDGATPAAGGAEAFALGPGEAIFFPNGMAETPPLGGEGEAVLLRFGVVPLPDDEADGTTPAADGFAPDSTVRVAVAEARLRAEPSVNGAVLAGLARGRTLVVTGEPVEADGFRWYPVEDPADPTVAGYVAAELLEEAPAT